MEFTKSGSAAGTFTVVLIHRRGQIRRCGRCFWSRGIPLINGCGFDCAKSDMGQTRKSARFTGMSVLPSTADVVGPPRHVRKVPNPEVGGLIRSRRRRG